MAESSKVIHVRNVGHEISENDLLQLIQSFGVITKLVMLRAKNQVFKLLSSIRHNSVLPLLELLYMYYYSIRLLKTFHHKTNILGTTFCSYSDFPRDLPSD